MRIYTKEYYTLMMSLGVTDMYEPVIHMLFDNNGLRYLTFRCEEAYAYRSAID